MVRFQAIRLLPNNVVTTLKGKGLKEVLPIENLNAHDEQRQQQKESVKQLISIPLNSDLAQTVQIGAQQDKFAQDKLLDFLRANMNVFA